MNEQDEKDITDFVSGVIPNKIDSVVTKVVNSKLWQGAFDNQDVLQTVRMALLKNFSEDEYRGDGLAAYAQTVAKRYCLMGLRKRYRDKRFLEEYLQSQLVNPRVIPTPESDALLTERTHEGLQVLRALSPKCRRALVMRFIYQQPYKTLAQKMNISDNNARIVVYRCLQKCRDILASNRGESEGATDDQ